MAERIKSNGKCPLTGNDCACACEKDCFIDVEATATVTRMSQAAFNSAVNSVSKDQLNNLPTGAKLNIADKIITIAKIRVSKPNQNI